MMIITGAKTPIDDLVGDNLWGGGAFIREGAFIGVNAVSIVCFFSIHDCHT